MAVKRIIANIGVERIDAVRTFHGDILDISDGSRMDRHLRRRRARAPSDQQRDRGGSGTPVPDLSMEVDDLDQMHRGILEAGFAVEYGPAVEPSGHAALARPRYARSSRAGPRRA
jgi:hypothetical protein